MPREKSKKRADKRERRLAILIADGKTPDEAQAIVDAEEANRKGRVPSDISAGGDSIALGVPFKDAEAQALLERQEAQAAAAEPPESPFGQLPEAPEQAGSQTPLRLLELLGNVGASFADSRATGKANKANTSAQARANLINTLRGSQTAAVEPQEPRTGILGTLARGLGAGARTVREGREFEATGDQATFENELSLGAADRAQQGLDLDVFKAEQVEGEDPVKLSERKATYDSIGGGLYDQNPDMSAEEIALAVQGDPRYQEDVASNPRLGSELEALAVQGYNKRESAVLGRGDAETAEARAEKKMSDVQSARMVGGFEDSLEALAITGVYDTGEGLDLSTSTEAGAARELYTTYDIPNMPRDFQLAAKGKHDLWAAKYHKLAFEKAEKDRAEAKVIRDEMFRSGQMELDVLKEGFRVEETLRSSVQALPGVKAFSGPQGIGAAFQKLDAAYGKYTDGKIGRDAMQLALVNQFQRLIDPATVREGDIALMLRAESWWARLNGKIEGFIDGGFVADKTIKSMHAVAIELEAAHRRFVEQEVGGAITVWNGIHKNNTVDQVTSDLIVESILGGDREEGEEETEEVPY
jgi:hypothetical protein